MHVYELINCSVHFAIGIENTEMAVHEIHHHACQKHAAERVLTTMGAKSAAFEPKPLMAENTTTAFKMQNYVMHIWGCIGISWSVGCSNQA